MFERLRAKIISKRNNGYSIQIAEEKNNNCTTNLLD